ncbi:MAG: hypothetical protein JWR11_3130 [Mycobacterium sp.]|nr:hypothetical protein [Mycobacterium sp.]
MHMLRNYAYAQSLPEVKNALLGETRYLACAQSCTVITHSIVVGVAGFQRAPVAWNSKSADTCPGQ